MEELSGCTKYNFWNYRIASRSVILYRYYYHYSWQYWNPSQSYL